MQPFVVGVLLGELPFDLGIGEDLPLLGIDHEDLARFEPPLRFDLGRGNLQYARFGGDDHQSVARDQVARRAQSVAVEHASGVAPVGEEDGCGAVPRRHEDRVVFVETLEPFREGVLFVEAFGYEHRQHVGQRHAGAHEEFEGVVERGAVAHPGLDDRVDALLHVAREVRIKHRFARAHPETVAADGVDLAVVAHEPEGLCEAPRREGVGRESRVDQRDGTRKVGALQVGEVVAQLARGEHALVDDRAGREAGDVAAPAVADVGVFELELDALADDVEQLLEALPVVASGDEDLQEAGFRGCGVGAEDAAVHGDVARSHQGETLLLDRLGDQTHEAAHLLALARQHDHADAVTALLRYGNAVEQDEFVGYLHENARPVARLVVGAFGTAVGHVLQDTEALIDDRVVFVSVDIDDKTDAAGIVFVFGTVEASVRHGEIRIHGQPD